jgi:hypothetical protein
MVYDISNYTPYKQRSEDWVLGQYFVISSFFLQSIESTLLIFQQPNPNFRILPGGFVQYKDPK